MSVADNAIWAEIEKERVELTVLLARSNSVKEALEKAEKENPQLVSKLCKRASSLAEEIIRVSYEIQGKLIASQAVRKAEKKG